MEEESLEVMHAVKLPCEPEEGVGGQVNGEPEVQEPGREDFQCEGYEELEEEEVVDRTLLDDGSSLGLESDPGASPHSSSQDGKDTPSSDHGSATVSCKSHAKYSTVSYRKIRKGNTKQRVDEFESMMHT